MPPQPLRKTAATKILTAWRFEAKVVVMAWPPLGSVRIRWIDQGIISLNEALPRRRPTPFAIERRALRSRCEVPSTVFSLIERPRASFLRHGCPYGAAFAKSLRIRI